MRMISDPPGEEVPDGEVVSFGKYKGYKFEEVPKEYLQWCLKEEERTPHMSADLKRICQWARHQLGVKETEYYQMDPEAPVNRTAGSARPFSSSSARASTDGSWVPVPDAGEMTQDMSFTISQEAKDEIYKLEHALAVAKQKYRVAPDRSIIGEDMPGNSGGKGAGSSKNVPVNKRIAE